MINKLRTKFVIVTTSLMVVVFGGFLIINTLYNKYWNDLEIVGMLEWIAHSGLFTSDGAETEKEDLLFEMLEDERPIWGVILDSDKKIISSQVIGAGTNSSNSIQINEKIIKKMCEYKNSEFKTSGLYYSYNEISDGRTLIVIMDDRLHGAVIIRVVGIIGLIVSGILALVLITFFLSKFVTEPAEQSLLREKRFISDASHELKTPLGAISINAQALETDNRDNIYIKNIISESNRMNRLIERLLTLAKLDELEEEISEIINISEICEEMALTYESIAFEKELLYSYEIEEGISIKGNADELRQLLAILIDNAIKNTPRNGQIIITCKRERKHKLIMVSNTGDGIPSDDLPHVFDRFYTSDKSREGNSFGLGLAIAKTIVDRHKGKIEIESVYGVNTILRCIF